MRIEGEHAFSASRAQVWAALNDPGALARTLPGAQRLDATGADEYALTVSVGVGAVRGTYEGTFSLTDKREREGCTVRASASGGPGSVQTVARMTLADADGGALLRYEADATVTGALAGVGQRLVAAAARRTTHDFFEALDRELAPAAAAAKPPRRRPLVLVLAGALIAAAGFAAGRWSGRR
jgi:carbon monoxide dehydrogenase subunit G